MTGENCSIEEKRAGFQGLIDAATGVDHASQYAKSREALAHYLMGKGNGQALKGEVSRMDQKIIKANPFMGDLNWMRHPNAILGDDFVDPLLASVKQYHEAVFDSKLGDDPAAKRRLWSAIVAPSASAELESVKGGNTHFNPEQQGYAINYLNDLKNGVDEFGPGGRTSPPLKRAGNIIARRLANNVEIGLMHLTSTERAVALYGAKNTAQGFADAYRATGGKLWREVPALKRAGYYGKEGGSSSLLTKTDNMVKNMAYYAAKAKGLSENQALKAAGKVAFGYTPGNMPEYQRGGNGAATLMRFDIELHKYYGQAIADIATGLAKGNLDKAGKGAMILATAALWRSALGGPKAAIPKYAWVVLKHTNPDLADQVDAAGEDMNLLKKATNIDIGDKLQPGAISLGAPFSMMKDTFKGGIKATDEMLKAAQSGDYNGMAINSIRAGQRFGSAFGGPLWDVASDVNTQRLMDVVNEVAKGEVPTEDILKRFYEKTIPQGEPLTEKGADEKEKRLAREAKTWYGGMGLGF